MRVQRGHGLLPGVASDTCQGDIFSGEAIHGEF